MFKAALELNAETLLPHFSTIWERKEIPSDWLEGITVKIPKKGALNNWNNCRGITLLSIPCKILAKIMIQRLNDAVDQQLREKQVGFWKGRGSIEQIFTLRNIFVQCTE